LKKKIFKCLKKGNENKHKQRENVGKNISITKEIKPYIHIICNKNNEMHKCIIKDVVKM